MQLLPIVALLCSHKLNKQHFESETMNEDRKHQLARITRLYGFAIGLPGLLYLFALEARVVEVYEQSYSVANWALRNWPNGENVDTLTMDTEIDFLRWEREHTHSIE